MNPDLDDRALEEELWLTIKLEREEEDPVPKSTAVFAYCTATVLSWFSRVAYLWFLAISVLEFMSEANDYRMAIPFLFLLLIALILKLRSLRRQEEREKSSEVYQVWTGDKLEEKKPEEVRTGDIVCINTGQHFPADVLVLASGRADEIALVDSFPYYGKPRMRVKLAISETQRIIRSKQFDDAVTRLVRLRGIVRVTQPIADIGFFRGQIKLAGYVTASALSLDHLCLKGSQLCHTPWVIGLIAYSGKDCKSEMNRSSTKRRKWSQIEKQLNQFFLAYTLCIVAAAAISAGVQSAVALDSDPFPAAFRVFLLLYSQAVPASLYVLLDLARIAHVMFFCAELNSDPAQLWPHNLRLAEALGQVEYVLTDKTGTLTENEISLKTVRVGQVDYTRCSLPDELHKQLCLTATSPANENRMLRRNTPAEGNTQLREVDEEMCGFTELRAIVARSRASMHTRFCECLALCNEVEAAPDQEPTSQSRLDLAIATGAVDLGVLLRSKSPTACTFTVGDVHRSYSILATTDFKPTLRRMRVLVQREDTTEGLLIVRGSVDVMRTIVTMDSEELEALERRAVELARKRMTIFVYAFKSFSASEMVSIVRKLDFLKEYDSKSRKREGLFKELERESVYLGLVALEDPILPQSISAVNDLLDKNVRVWILSGDREQSTLAAAAEVGLLSSHQRVASISDLDQESVCSMELVEAIRTFVLKENLSQDISPANESYEARMDGLVHMGSIVPRGRDEHALQRRSVLHLGKSVVLNVQLNDIEPNFVLTIDGTSFRTALETVDCRKYLSALLFTAKTVLFHSMLPHQKALAVRFVRENFAHRPVTLAVGDEENDISMIQEADIGIAVRRKGNRSVGAVSDLEISSFAVLAPLLLKYGKFAYAKIGKMLKLWVYASALPVLLCMVFARFSDFSGTSVVQAVHWILYILLMGVLVLAVSLMDSIAGSIEDSEYQESSVIVEERFTLTSLAGSLGLSAVHTVLTFIFLSLSLRSVVAADGSAFSYEYQAASFFLTMTLTAVVHFLISAETLTIPLLAIASILVGTLVFALHQLASDNGAVLQAVFALPVVVLGEFAAVLSCAVASYVSTARRHRRKVESEEVNVNRETSVPETTSRLRPHTDGRLTLEKIYRNTPKWQKLGAHSNYKMHRFLLQFSSPIVESEYFHEMMVVGFKKLPGALFSAALAVYLVYSSVAVRFLLGKVLAYAFTVTVICSAPLLRWNLEIVTTLHFLAVAAKFAAELVHGYTDVLSFLLPLEFALYAGMDWRHNVGLQLWNITTVFYTLIHAEGGTAFTVCSLFLVLTHSLSLSVFNYLNEKETRTEFKLLKTTKLRVDRAKELLHCLFPSFVLRPIWKRQMPIALDQSEVTVLFCDICEFDAISSELNSQELMDLLDDLFKKLDDMCETYGLAKIETVGKTYLACAGLKERENEIAPSLKLKNHARRACEMAFEIMTLFKEYTIAQKPLQANIGINSGPVIAGVVGSEKPQFALIGDTVNTASRMSSTAPHPSSIQISAETYALLEHNHSGITVTPRKVEVKGKGEMEVYLIQESEMCVVRTRTHSVIDRTARRPKTGDTLHIAKGEIFGNWRFSTMMDREAYEAAMASRTVSMMQREKEEEKAFKSGAVKRQMTRLVYGFAGIVAAALAETALWAVRYSATELWPQVALSLLSIIAWWRLVRLSTLRLFPWVLLTLGLTLSVAMSYSSVFYTETHSVHTVLVELLVVVYFVAFGGLFFHHTVTFTLVLALYWAGVVGLEGNRLRRVEAGLAVASGVVIAIFFSYKRQHNLKVYTSFELRVSQQMTKTKELIRRIMPPHVLASLLNEKHKVDVLADVTLVFADIVGFTALSSHKSPTEMVHLLSDLFSGFDLAAARNHVFKVHTIGDCYVAMGYTGLTAGRDRQRECLNIISQAHDMIGIISSINEEHPGISLGMRIGVHTGRVIAGINGAKIVRYDIYGSDVLIANKMESNGQAGRIHVSDVTKAMLEKGFPGAFTFEFNKQVEIKSISETHSGFFIASTTLFSS